MSEALSWDVMVDADGGHTVTLRGKVTGSLAPAEWTSLAQSGPLRLDLADITQINSSGVREWILFMRAVAEKPHPTSWIRVAPTLVRQLNTIANFAGGATIVSVQLPYYCDACGHEQAETLALDGARDIAESMTCQACGDTAEFDDIPASYLAFAER